MSDCSTDGNLFIYLQRHEFDFENLQLGRVIARLEVKAVQRKGHGIFAREDIKKGAFICEYVGYVLWEDFALQKLTFSSIVARSSADRRQTKEKEIISSRGEFRIIYLFWKKKLISPRFVLVHRQFFLHDIHGMCDACSIHQNARRRVHSSQLIHPDIFFTGKQNHPSFGEYCLDPTHRGNIGRMINHSCQPNVSTLEVLFNTESQVSRVNYY